MHFDDAEKMLIETRPNVCIIEMSLLKDLKAPLLLCAKLGINAITTCEEAFNIHGTQILR